MDVNKIAIKYATNDKDRQLGYIVNILCGVGTCSSKQIVVGGDIGLRSLRKFSPTLLKKGFHASSNAQRFVHEKHTRHARSETSMTTLLDITLDIFSSF